MLILWNIGLIYKSSLECREIYSDPCSKYLISGKLRPGHSMQICCTLYRKAVLKNNRGFILPSNFKTIFSKTHLISTPPSSSRPHLRSSSKAYSMEFILLSNFKTIILKTCCFLAGNDRAFHVNMPHALRKSCFEK